MKIFAINNLSKINSANPTGQNSTQTNFGLKIAEPLKHDSVSFGAAAAVKFTPQIKLKEPRKVLKSACNTVSDIMEDSYKKDVERRLTRISTTYLDIIESIAMKLKDYGVSFDREYGEANAIKSAQSFSSKIKRSGNFHVPDRIRATLFVKNPYDLSLLDEKILPEFEKRGYVIADNYTDVKGLMKRGYVPTEHELVMNKKLMPDIDVRLEDTNDSMAKFASKYPYSIGRAQKSGYEDIQMRLVRQFDESKNPVQHELIIIFGPNYAAAKHIESDRIYSNTRKYGELLYSNYLKDETANSQKLNRYIDLIRKMMTGKISEKLYENAKNKDLYNIADDIPINITSEHINAFENYAASLYNTLSDCYSELRKINRNNPELIKEINSAYKKDKKIISEVYVKLKESLEYFKSGDYKKDLQV